MHEKRSEREKLLTEFVLGAPRRNRILWGTADEAYDLDMTNAQREALIAIRNIPNCHVSDIAAWLNVTNGAVTQLVDGLEQRGIVKRQADDRDARKVCLVITSEGMDKLKRANDHYVSKLEEIFGGVTTEQLRTLIDIQDVILSHGIR